MAARFHQLPAGPDHRRRVRHVFQHFHARHHIEGLRLLDRQLLHRHLTVFEIVHPGLSGMQASDGQRRFAHVDAQHLRTPARHRFGQNTAAAAHVQHTLAAQRGAFVNPVQPQRVDLVQRLEFGVGVPPAGGQRFKLGDFGGIDIGCGHDGGPEGVWRKYNGKRVGK